MAFYYQLLFYTIRLIAISSHYYTNCQFKLEMMSILPSNNQLTFLWRLVKVFMNIRIWTNTSTFLFFQSFCPYATSRPGLMGSMEPLRKRCSNQSIFEKESKESKEKKSKSIAANPTTPAAAWSQTLSNQNKLIKKVVPMYMFQWWQKWILSLFSYKKNHQNSHLKLELSQLLLASVINWNGSLHEFKSVTNPVRTYFLSDTVILEQYYFIKFDFQCPKLKNHDLWQDGWCTT